MSIMEALEIYPWLFFSLVIFVSLAFGSFLNVVIYRLPLMMENEWREQCHEFLDIESEQAEAKKCQVR